jgi:hypothetical protein
MSVQAIVNYNVNIVGIVPQATVEAALAAPVLDQTVAQLLGLSVATDATTNPSGTQSERTLTYSLVQPVIQNTNNPITNPRFPHEVSVYSTSAQDTNFPGGSGTGVQRLTVNYLDPSMGAQSFTIQMHGKTPVIPPKQDVYQIVSVTFVAVGSLGTSAGMITILGFPFVDQRADGTLENVPAQVMVTVPAGYINNNPQQTCVELVELCTGQLQAAIGCPVIAVAPVIS